MKENLLECMETETQNSGSQERGAALLQKPNRTWPVEQIFWKEDYLPQLPKVLSESWEGNETRAYMRILRTMSGDWQEHKESG